MKGRLPLPAAIAKLYEAVAELEAAYGEHKRKFTLDGHLLGSIGEVLVATAMKMRLLKMSAPVHDAVCNDRGDVQIKITAGNSIAMRHACVLRQSPELTLTHLVGVDGRDIIAAKEKHFT